MQAVENTLRKNPNILLSEQDVVSRNAALEGTQALFDWQLNASVSYADQNTPLTESEQDAFHLSKLEEGQANAQVGLEKLLPSGIVLEPVVGVSNTEYIVGEDPSLAESSIVFAVKIPLLKGSGKTSVMRDVYTADLDRQVSLLALRQVISESLLNTVLAYWNYVAAGREVRILSESEQQSQKLVDDLRLLVKSAERPASDIDQAMASLHDRTAFRMSSEQRFLAAKHDLGIQMGIPVEEIVSLPSAADGFPELSASSIPQTLDVRPYAALACQKRDDLQASRKSEEAFGILFKASELDARRQLDMILGAGYAGAGEEWSMEYEGPDYSAGVEFKMAFGNRAARSVIAQRKATCDQVAIQTRELERQIQSNVVLALNTLQLSILELEKQREAVLSHEKAVADERKKLHLGMSTMLALIEVDDRLRNARVNEIFSLKNAADALIRLRYEMGALIDAGDGLNAVKVKNLSEIPSLNE